MEINRDIRDEVDELDKVYTENIPWIIAHEYNRIFNLLDMGEVYGALLQLKDTAEVVIKFYALVGLARIYHKEEKSDREIELLFQVTNKKMSLGDWGRVIRELSNIFREGSMNRIYKSILGLTDSNGDVSIVEWRNQCLGHGALGYSNTKEYQEAFVPVLNAITEFIENNIKDMELISLIAENKDKEATMLIGTECELSKKMALKVILRDENVIISLFPFLTVVDAKIFLFDTYTANNKKVFLLNYYYGIKKNYKKGHIYKAISEIHQNYAKSSSTMKLSKAESYENTVFSYEMEEIIKKNSTISDSVKAEYLESWLNEKVHSTAKGVFWLQMRGGMGKTICAQQLEKIGKVKINIDNTAIRVLYLNNSYNSSVELILQEVELIFTHSKNGKVLVKGEGLPKIDRNSSDKKKEFAQYLGNMKKILSEQGKMSGDNLLLVIDGLDELSELAFCDYIPNPEQLDEGIFIFLTSRIINSLDLLKRDKLNRIKTSKDGVYIPEESKTVYGIMNQYVLNNYPVIGEKDIERLFMVSKYNFGFLHFIITTLQMTDIQLDIDSNISRVAEQFLEYVKRTYGEKYNKQIFLIIYCFANIRGGVTLKQLSLLLGEEQISFELVGIMQDLRGIVELDHSSRNEYHLMNDDFKSLLGEALAKINVFNYEQTLCNLLLEKISEITIKDDFDSKLQSNEYLLIFTVFVSEMNVFLRDLNYYFTGFMLLIIACLLEQCFKDKYSKMTNNLYLLYDKMFIFTTEQVEMIFEGIKEYDEDEICLYQTLAIWFGSGRMWSEWYRDKIRNEDVRDILEENSLLHKMYEQIGLLNQSIFTYKDEDILLKGLMDGREKELLCEIQQVHKRLGDYEKEIKYAFIMLDKMKEAESESFKPDYALEYRTLARAYDALGNTDKARIYLGMAELNEKENSRLSPEIKQYLEKRVLQEKFDRVYKKAKKLDTFDNQQLEILIKTETEFYEAAMKIYHKNSTIDRECFCDCINLERKMAVLYHDSGKTKECFKCFERIIELYNLMNGEDKFILYTEFMIAVIYYAANLSEFFEVEKAEEIINTYISDYDAVKKDLQEFTLSKGEYECAMSCMNIAYYIVNSILHPERLNVISRSKRALSIDDLIQCDNIVDRYIREYKLNLYEISPISEEKNSDVNEYFILIEKDGQLLCRNKVFSKKGKSMKGKSVYKFNQKNCRSCNQERCPAYKAPHQVSILE